jgi:DNA-binding winged helix-turn-helix (wHTH) protein/predicted ATPase
MLPARYFVFGPFRLDVFDERLWMQNRSVRLGHKALTVLTRLIVAHGQLVSKDDLFEAGWRGTAVSDAVLTTVMRELRKALGDEARRPRFIETVHGRGYRFVAPVAESNNGMAQVEPQHVLVGREREFFDLQAWFAAAQEGNRRIAFIAGEAGIGKTALVDSFLSSVGAKRTPLLVAQGQCIETYGAGEAYLPILEALGRLGRDPELPLRDILREHAPAWLSHLPSLRTGESLPASPATPARMLRELADALEVLTARAPLILVLEDLHWSDTATLEWLAYAARRRDPARLLVLSTYRPMEAIQHNQMLRRLVAESGQGPQCAELVLDFLSCGAVEAYLRRRCGNGPRLEEIARVLHRRTAGHPLFLRAIVDELLRDGGVERGDLTAIGNMVPSSVRQFIERRLEALSPDDREILEAASVAGDTFSVASLAAVNAVPASRVESRCAEWDRENRFVAGDGQMPWPDGSLAPRYRFRHALYHEVVYARISPERRVRLHRAFGDHMENAYGKAAAAVAAELAMHFEQGHDPARAVLYLTQSARNALDRSAYAEARAHLERGQRLLPLVAEGRLRSERELDLLLLLGRVLAATKGWAVEEAESVFLRTRELCEQLENKSGLLQTLWGLIGVTFVGADFRRAQSLGRQVLGLANTLEDPVYGVLGHMEVGGTAFHLGESGAASRRHFGRAEFLYTVEQHRSHVAAFGVDMGVFSRSWATHFWWHKGYLDRARASSEATVSLARKLSHPLSLTVALAYAAMLHQFCQDVGQLDTFAEAAIRVCSEHGFPYYLAWAEVLRGWSRAAAGSHGKGVAEIRRAIEALEARAGARLSYYRALLAEACLWSGDIEGSLDAINQAFSDIRRSEERWWEPELHRLRGELLLSRELRRPAEAEACFRNAMEAARGQEAKSLEIRAALSLGRLWREQGRRAEAHRLVSEVHGWFAEGSNIPVMKAAASFLEELASELPGARKTATS